MGLPHSLVRQQLRLPLREGGSDLKAAGGSSHHAPPARNTDFSLIMASLTSSYLSCTMPRGAHSQPDMSASTITAPVHGRGAISHSHPQCYTAGIPLAPTCYRHVRIRRGRGGGAAKGLRTITQQRRSDIRGAPRRTKEASREKKSPQRGQRGRCPAWKRHLLPTMYFRMQELCSGKTWWLGIQR